MIATTAGMDGVWTAPATERPSNEEIADRLERVADLLHGQDANPFRVGAYLAAARTIRSLDRPAARVLDDEGVEGLVALPDVGRRIAALIREYARTGRIGLLERLAGQAAPEHLLARVPGIGEVLAERIHARLSIESLEDLELAAHDGRLATVPGFGEGRLRQTRLALAAMLSRRPPPRGGGTARPEAHPAAAHRPGVATLLDVDAEYREKAAARRLSTIAPRRFNPGGEAWLPILHTERGDWHFTVLYSNTARAHRLGRTRDWVVIYYDQDGVEGQCTVVTEQRGELEGRRVVRGREAEQLETRSPDTEPAWVRPPSEPPDAEQLELAPPGRAS